MSSDATDRTPKESARTVPARSGARSDSPGSGAADLDAARPVPGQGSDDRYVEQGELGRGGMASVHEVTDRSLLRPVALKRLEPHLEERPTEVQRFIEEAQITGQLEHPGIVPVHDLGTDAEGVHFLSMKLVRGETLEQAIAAAGDRRLEPDVLASFLQILLKVCDAVAFAHSRGVLHRDLKPANIMVGDFGQVYVMDWGVAYRANEERAPSETGEAVRVSRPPGIELDAAGDIIGTPGFMPPEQVHFVPSRLDERADVFALGAMLYAIIVGAPPYDETSSSAALLRAYECDFLPPSAVVGPDLPLELESIVMKAMAENPKDRYQQVTDLQRDVERFLRGTWHLPTRTFAAGEQVVAEGEVADEAFIIVEGHCEVLKELGPEGAAKLLRRLGPGDVFGETAVLSEKPRTATVQAIDDVTVMVVTRESLSAALGLRSWVAPFVKALAERFREVDARLRELESDETD